MASQSHPPATTLFTSGVLSLNYLCRLWGANPIRYNGLGAKPATLASATKPITTPHLS